MEQHGQSFPLWKDQLFEVAGQQLAAVECQHLLQPQRPLHGRTGRVGERAGPRRAALESQAAGGLEGGHVRGDGSGIELYRGAVGRDDGACGHVRRLQLMAQRGERHAELVAARRQIILGPEQVDQQLAGMRVLAVIRQVGEQRPGLLRLKARDHPVALRCPEPSEQLDPPGHLHGLSLLAGT